MPYKPTGNPPGRPPKPKPEPPPEPEAPPLIRAVNYWRHWDERDPTKSGQFCKECFTAEQLGPVWNTVACAHGTWYNIH